MSQCILHRDGPGFNAAELLGQPCAVKCGGPRSPLSYSALRHSNRTSQLYRLRGGQAANIAKSSGPIALAKRAGRVMR
jgi:hypothetical protein